MSQEHQKAINPDIFSATFNSDNENRAVHLRGQFIQRFPLDDLPKISLDEYVIGRGTHSFCSSVEAKTRAWANMQGATSSKFGIYYGRTKSDSTKIYRFTKRFGNSTESAFSEVKKSLLDLIEAGKNEDYKGIDNNLLSQMFKAKILSLYFPELYINICSKEHLENIALNMGIPQQTYISSYQAKLLETKKTNQKTKNWSNPKYMSYLYAVYNQDQLELQPSIKIRKTGKIVHPTVNFEDINADREKIGKISEEFAINWEKSRLVGLGYEELVNSIDDRRNKPSYGYDYLSFNTPDEHRYIEVKTVGKDRSAGCQRFYLSENERVKSLSDALSDNYYFYLVIYNKHGEPCDVVVRLASQMYEQSATFPCAYTVNFDLSESSYLSCSTA